jgi:hypothetical protein
MKVSEWNFVKRIMIVFTHAKSVLEDFKAVVF